MPDFGVMSKDERLYLRELAQKYLDYANLPVMKEREALWYAHNALRGQRPLVVMELGSFMSEMMPPLRCTTPGACQIERSLVQLILNHELINDDKVLSPYYTVNWKINIRPFDLTIKTHRATDERGRSIGYAREHPIHDLKQDFHLIKPSVYSVDRDYTMQWKSYVEDAIGDILPVRIKNTSLHWHAAMTARIVELMGMESMLYAMMDYPDEFHRLMAFVKDDILAYAKWQEREGLLTTNGGNDYAGAGSYGFTHELPGDSYTGRVTTKDLWLNTNSQETVGISPAMFHELCFPYYRDLAQEFGLVYFGCCEPVHGIWENSISKLPGLRKVSVSAWCDEDYMGNALKGSGVIYSRKPSPNFVSATEFDEEAFRQHIAKTLKAAKGCELEIIFRDIYTLQNDQTRPGRAVAIVRELIEEMW